MKIGEQLKIFREDLNLTHQDVKDLVKIPIHLLKDVESGKTMPTAFILWNLCKLYDFDYRQACIDAGIIIKK